MTKKRVLITGGAGFLGRNIVRGLTGLGHEVVVFDNLSYGKKPDAIMAGTVEWVLGDVLDDELLCSAARGCDFIFHFAGVIGGDMSAEIASAKIIAKAALDGGCSKIIYASSCAVYGRSAMDIAITEDHPAEPLSGYAVVKRDNEAFFSSLYREHGLSSVLLRYFNPYGPGQDDRMVIPRFFHLALKGEPIVIYGSGDQIRDFVYIDDAVKATLAVAERSEGTEIVNIAGGRETSIGELVRQIIELTDSGSSLEFTPVPDDRRDNEVNRRIGSTDKLKKLAGFVPSTTMKDGLRRTLETIRRAQKESQPLASRR